MMASTRPLALWVPGPAHIVTPGPLRILDLFCKAGGASMGYHLAFPDAHIVGVDIEPQKHYPFTFVQADAMTFDLQGFDLIHASPPCQDHSALSVLHTSHGTGWMLAATIARLREQDTPWVVENVPGSEASMSAADFMVTLCGSSFGLKVRRHRNFASSFLVLGPPCDHETQGPPIGVTGHGAQGHEYRRGKAIATQQDRRDAMGIQWMNRDELAQAIPPAYTEYVAEHYPIRQAVAA